MDNSATIAIVSTLLSSIAVVGAVVGLLIQVYQVRIGRIHAFRSTQSDLIQMLLAHPEITPTYRDTTGDPNLTRRYLVMNWQMQHMLFGYLINEMSDTAIRLQLDDLFSSSQELAWWARVRSIYATDADGRRERRFFAIVEAAYAEQLARQEQRTREQAEPPE